MTLAMDVDLGFNAYKRYKAGTRTFTSWLVEAARSSGGMFFCCVWTQISGLTAVALASGRCKYHETTYMQSP